jgi:hypothetical protein
LQHKRDRLNSVESPQGLTAAAASASYAAPAAPFTSTAVPAAGAAVPSLAAAAAAPPPIPPTPFPPGVPARAFGTVALSSTPWAAAVAPLGGSQAAISMMAILPQPRSASASGAFSPATHLPLAKSSATPVAREGVERNTYEDHMHHKRIRNQASWSKLSTLLGPTSSAPAASAPPLAPAAAGATSASAAAAASAAIAPVTATQATTTTTSPPPPAATIATSTSGVSVTTAEAGMSAAVPAPVASSAAVAATPAAAASGGTHVSERFMMDDRGATFLDANRTVESISPKGGGEGHPTEGVGVPMRGGALLNSSSSIKAWDCQRNQVGEAISGVSQQQKEGSLTLAPEEDDLCSSPPPAVHTDG